MKKARLSNRAVFVRILITVSVVSMILAFIARVSAQTTTTPKWQTVCGVIPNQTANSTAADLLRTNHDRCVNRVIAEFLEENSARWSQLPVEYFSALPTLSMFIIVGIAWRIGVFA